VNEKNRTSGDHARTERPQSTARLFGDPDASNQPAKSDDNTQLDAPHRGHFLPLRHARLVGGFSLRQPRIGTGTKLKVGPRALALEGLE
jgi:hypothetical protein